jgi:DNA-binding transcriptional LysR family regulator
MSLNGRNGSPRPACPTTGRIPRSRQFDTVSIAAFRSFASVVEAGGFSAASRHLGVSVSAVSKHVEIIEMRLQTNLLLRTTRRITLTEAGANFYNQCRTLLDNIDEVVSSNAVPGALSGRLRVVSPPSFTACILSPALPRFLKRHPELRMELKITTTVPDFLRDGIDLAIRMTPEHANSDRVARIGDAPSVLCASPESLANYGVPLNPDDLALHRCLGGISSPYGEVWRFKINEVTIDQPIHCSFLCDTGDVLRELCLQGSGIGGFYEYHIEQEIQSGRLVPVLGPFQADVSAVYIIQPSARYAAPNASAFIEFIRDIIPRRGDGLR